MRQPHITHSQAVSDTTQTP